MKFGTTLSLLLIAGIFLSCSENTDRPATATGQTDVELIPADSAVLIDDISPLDGVFMAFHLLNDNRFILGDNKPGIYLFEDNEMIMQYGASGQGPCEYSEISASDVKDGVLYVLSSEQVKIIEFDVNTGECIGEYSEKVLSGITHLRKENSGDSFLTLKGSFSGIQPDTSVLLYRFYDTETFDPLELTYGRIEAAPSVINFRVPNLSFAPYDDSYYFYLPQTDSVYNYTPATGQIRSFAHGIDLNLEEIERIGQDFQKLLDLLSKEVRMIGSVYSSPEWVAIEYIYEDVKNEEEQITTLNFFNHDGIPLTNTRVSDLIGYDNGLFYQLTEDTEATDYPFRMVKLRPQFN